MRFSLPFMFRVLTLATLTPKISSTALAISILLALFATSKVYFLSSVWPMDCSVMMGRLMMS